ncbi:MAG: hypothetical protein NWF13_09745 [Candidatus Bathyarchaeota archaeon]|nr:hypothetical protein [Candidatus Bathyarchaeota archaeon]
MSNKDLLFKQLRDLHGYIRLLGENINQIQSRLDQLERNINEMKSTHTASIETNRTGLEDVKKVIASKAEVNSLFQELNKSLGGSLPALPVRTVEEPEVEEPEVEEPEVEEPEVEEPEAYQEEEREQEKSREEDRRRRFPFLRRFQE